MRLLGQSQLLQTYGCLWLVLWTWAAACCCWCCRCCCKFCRACLVPRLLLWTWAAARCCWRRSSGRAKAADALRRDPGSSRGPSDLLASALPAELSRPLLSAAAWRRGSAAHESGMEKNNRAGAGLVVWWHHARSAWGGAWAQAPASPSRGRTCLAHKAPPPMLLHEVRGSDGSRMRGGSQAAGPTTARRHPRCMSQLHAPSPRGGATMSQDTRAATSCPGSAGRSARPVAARPAAQAR